MQRSQEKEDLGVEEAEVPGGDLAGELWGAIEETLGPAAARALRRVLEDRGEVPRVDFEGLVRALETLKDLLGPHGGEILEEYAVQALHPVDRDPIEP